MFTARFSPEGQALRLLLGVALLDVALLDVVRFDVVRFDVAVRGVEDLGENERLPELLQLLRLLRLLGGGLLCRAAPCGGVGQCGFLLGENGLDDVDVVRAGHSPADGPAFEPVPIRVLLPDGQEVVGRVYACRHLPGGWHCQVSIPVYHTTQDDHTTISVGRPWRPAAAHTILFGTSEAR